MLARSESPKVIFVPMTNSGTRGHFSDQSVQKWGAAGRLAFPTAHSAGRFENSLPFSELWLY